MRITIIGCGNMGTAMAQSLSHQQTLSFYDRNHIKSEQLADQGFGKAHSDIESAIHHSELLILAVKPSNLTDIAAALRPYLTPHQMVFSLLAGTSLETLKTHFPKNPLFRLMPNLAVLYGEGVLGIATDKQLKKEETETLGLIFEPLGRVYWLPEAKINALASLAGSGPAFLFSMAEAMVDAGIAMGFNAKEAQKIVFQMIKGGVALLEISGKTPCELKWQVTSPAGTTIAGLKAFEEHAVRSGIINAFLAAYERAENMQ